MSKCSSRSIATRICVLTLLAQASTCAIAAVGYFSNAQKISADVRLHTTTFNNSPSDYVWLVHFGVRARPFQGPGFTDNTAWENITTSPGAIAGVAWTRNEIAVPGTYSVRGEHKWRTTSDITNIRVTLDSLTITPAGGCTSVVNPVSSLITLDGEVRSLPLQATAPLVAYRSAEDGRNIISDVVTTIGSDFTTGRAVFGPEKSDMGQHVRSTVHQRRQMLQLVDCNNHL